MSHILPLTAAEVERRLLKVDDLAIHTAVASDNFIKVVIEHFIEDGSSIKFKAPVDCSAVTRLQVQYPNAGQTAVKNFAFADANGNDIGEVDNLFAKDAIVKVILDMEADIDGQGTGAAFVQNANTNAYIENTFAKSWNDLPDKPFGETAIIGDTLYWDGNTEGLPNVMDGMVWKVSDNVPTMNDLSNGATLGLTAKHDGHTEIAYTSTTILHDEAMPGLIVVVEVSNHPMWGAYIIDESIVGIDLGGYAFPEAGVYLLRYQDEGGLAYVSSLTIPGYVNFETKTVKPVESKYLPEHLQFGFSDDTVFEPFTWTDNTDVLETVRISSYGTMGKISSDYFRPIDVEGCTKISNERLLKVILGDIEENDWGWRYLSWFIFSTGEAKWPEGDTILSRGLWILPSGVESFTLNPAHVAKPIDKKLLPEDLGTAIQIITWDEED